MLENEDVMQNHRSQLEYQCQLYLLGELDTAKRDALEAQMGTSDELMCCLAEQAELIAGIGESSAVAAAHTNQSRIPASLWSVLAIATAACVAFVIGRSNIDVPRADQVTTSDREALADAWALARSGPALDNSDESELELAELELYAADQDVPTWLALGVAAQHRDSQPIPASGTGGDDEQG